MINDILFDVCDTINKQFAEDHVDCTVIPDYSGYVKNDYTHKITDVFYGLLLIFPEGLYARHTLTILIGCNLKADRDFILHALLGVSSDRNLQDNAVRLLKPSDFTKRRHLTATIHSLQKGVEAMIETAKA